MTDDIRRIRLLTGHGLTDCKQAYLKMRCDIPLACGYLKARSLAVHVKGDREQWNLEQAEKYSKDFIKNV